MHDACSLYDISPEFWERLMLLAAAAACMNESNVRSLFGLSPMLRSRLRGLTYNDS